MTCKIIEAYRKLVKENTIHYSSEQLFIINALQSFDNKIGLFSKQRGIYLHGEVGRGKSMLVDLYFHHSRIKKRKRVHFHKFMQEIHQQLRLFKHEKDPMWQVGKKMAKHTKLLFLDELHIHDIGNAMILSRLFTALFANKVFVLITSNYHPDELYKDGLRRENFLPAIALIKQKMQVIQIKGDQDYRLLDQSLSKYFIKNDKKLEERFLRETNNRIPISCKLSINSRVLHIKRKVDHTVWFTFDELCLAPLGANDYQFLAKNFHTIFISNIPYINEVNAMTRFMLLIDELYENKVALFCSAISTPEMVCAYPEFKRTTSRLIEMCR